eukprot:9489705-Pyramimonas_sp.AAC.1
MCKGRQVLANLAQAESLGLQRHLPGYDNAAIISTGFAAAFPSLLHGWLFAVPSAMRMPSFILGFHQMLCASDVVVVTLGGQRFGRFQITRGVRPGDASSMALFCLCLDPVIRWMQNTLPAQ